jgi:hypothetical protein
MKMLEKLFGFNPRETRVRTEILAGITTFLTMAYILAVNPNILAATGMDKGALFTTTVIASAFATLLMAFYAKLPFGLAPGMGLNAFFAYTVCLTLGYTWQFALTAVLLEGIIFILQTDERNEQADTCTNGIAKAQGQRIYDFFTQIGYRQQNEYDSFQKYSRQSKLPSIAQCKTNGIGKKRIQPHSRCQSERQFGIKGHQQRSKSRSDDCCREKRSLVHTCSRQNVGIDSQNIGHGQKGRDSGQDFRTHTRLTRVKTE